PKNLIVGAGGIMVIDFEVTHFGDPAFDVAFCINHFLLTCFRCPDRASQLLARVDGKSPVEYIREEPLRDAVRRAALGIILEGPTDLETCYAIVKTELCRLEEAPAKTQ